MKEWLQLFRAQTGFATFYTVAVPYLLAGGHPGLLVVLLPLSLLLHYASFGHNSVMDYWHDVSDPHKKHHPLVSGVIDLRRAHQVVHAMLCAGTGLMVLLTLLASPRPAEALAALLMYVALGHAYNDGLGKHMTHSWAPISLCFTCLVAYGWFLGGGEANAVLALLLAAALSTMFYQIAFEGNLKDVCHEDNLLRRLARELECRFASTTLIRYAGPTFWWLRVIVDTAVLVAVLRLVSAPLLAYLVLLLVTSVQAYFIAELGRVRHGLWRDEVLELFGRIEALQYFRVMVVIIGDLRGLALYALLVVAGATYFVLMNRLLWGTRWGPKV